MDRIQAEELIAQTFKNKFDKNTFRKFIINLLDGINEDKAFSIGNAQVKEAFRKNILSYQRIGQYTDKNRNITDVLSVHVSKDCSLDRNRTMLRNFVVEYMKQRGREYVLAAFYSDNKPDWRFSYIRLDSKLSQDDKGRFKVIEEFSSAKRLSFLVGENEPNHTAQASLIPLLIKDYPAIAEIQEAFNVERVSKEFFDNYKELFLQLVDNLKEIRKNDERINYEFTLKSITEANFCKKLLGQLVFLYFIQKKGWLGVPVSENWGRGDKQFLRHTFEKAVREGKNFFNDYLEPLFYNALANGARDEQYFELLNCKIPFLNGGLFEPVCEYDWVNTDIVFENDIFSNTKKNKAGDTGTGILDVFDRYNFTVKEDEPLEKEVAIDPEMLGKVFENLLEVVDRKSKGAFYTPREIVHYMCRESLINYLCSELDAKDNTKDDITSNKLTRQAVENFIYHSDEFTQTEAVAVEKENKNSVYAGKFEKSIKDNAERIDKALENIKICDPAIGSGAFPVGILNEIVRARLSLAESGYLKETKKHSVYEYKRQAIQNSIYGVDIESGAVEIAKLRLWLSLVVDEESIENIKALPNLDYKIVCGNSLLNVERNLFNDNLFKQLEELKPQFFNETRKSEKRTLKKQIDGIIKELTKDGTFDFEIYFSEVFHKNGGFDIVIGNPPYVSNKATTDTEKKLYIQKYGMSDDLYNYFYVKSINEILKNNGTIAFITSDTYLTINSKLNLRELFLRNKILEIIKTDNVFENAMVSPAILILMKTDTSGINYNFTFKDAVNNFNMPNSEIIDADTYRNAVNKVLFYPNLCNRGFYRRYNDKINKLYSEYWECISTSKNILKHAKHLEILRNNLEPGDITLLGCITEGGQGLATANNGRYIAVRKSSKWVNNIIESRPKKLAEAVKTKKIEELSHISDYKKYINTLSEQEIAELFDKLKEKYGRDIFGQGYIYKIIDDCQLAEVNLLSNDEKENGIDSSKKYYVPYDKGDKDGNRWYLETPFAIAWSKENVWFLKTNSGKKGEGMPVVRNPQFYFKEGFCWSDISDTRIRARLKSKSIHDVTSMSLFSKVTKISDWYFVCLVNANLTGNIIKSFINNTQHFQINDARQLPIIIPNQDTLNKFKKLFDEAYNIKRQQFSKVITEKEALPLLESIENQIDIMVYKLYDLTYQEVLTIDKDFSMSEEEYREYKEYNNTKI